MHRILLLALALGGLFGCNPSLWPNPPAVAQPEGACAGAERHLRELSCSKEASTGGGFGAFCERMASRGVDEHPACVSRIQACAEFDGASRGEGCS